MEKVSVHWTLRFLLPRAHDSYRLLALPEALLLDLSTDLSLFDTARFGLPTGVGLNALHALVRLSAWTPSVRSWRFWTDPARLKAAEERLQAVAASERWFTVSWGTIISVSLIAMSVANAASLFSKRRQDEMWLRREPLMNPNAREVEADLFTPRPPWTKRWRDYFWSLILTQEPTEARKVTQLTIWTPDDFNLRLFTVYSPVVSLLWHFLSVDSALLYLPVIVICTAQIWYLVTLYQQTLRDRLALHAEVAHEYNEKLVRPRLFPFRRDAGTQTQSTDTAYTTATYTPDTAGRFSTYSRGSCLCAPKSGEAEVGLHPRLSSATGTSMGLSQRAQPAAHQPIIPLSTQRHPSEWSKRLKRWSDFSVLSVFEPKRGQLLPRRVLVGVPLPVEAWLPTKKGAKALKNGRATPETVERRVDKKPAPEFSYSSNQVLTSKYNLVTFVPKNLLEQFRRVANIFFLVLVILQFFPQFTNVSPALAALPLLVVLGITGIKDGFEDYRRHINDRSVNTSPVRILQGGGFSNPNLTQAKTRPLSFRGLGIDRILPRWLGGTGGYTKEELHASDKLADRAEAEKAAEDGLDAEKAHHRKSWWGAKRVQRRKKKVMQPSEPPRTAPGGGHVQAAQQQGLHVETDLMQMESRDPYADEEYNDLAPLSPRIDSLATRGRLETAESSYLHPEKAQWLKVAWEDLRVGDFVKLRGNEAVPADMCIVSTSEEENVCYVETKNLDGETNLKSRHAVPDASHLRSARDCAQARFIIASEAPDNNMFRYQAAFEAHDGRVDAQGQPLKSPITLNTVLLRGTVIRNTDWVIGCVITTGRDTKIVMNSGLTPSKRSKVERQMNPQVFVNLFLLALACIMCAIGDHYLEVYYFNRSAYWEAFAIWGDDNPQVNGIISFANGMIAFQNIVPISLYISIEFIRLIQALFIWADDEIFYEPTQRRTHARSWNLSDDLGQIEYIFSDKTGTLTQNSMVFHHCTVGGKRYKGDDEVPSNIITHEDDAKKGSDTSSGTRIGDTKDPDLLKPARTVSDDVSSIYPPTTDDKKKVRLPPEVAKPFHDAEIDRILQHEPDSPQGRLLHGFFVNLALCHTVLAAEAEDGTIQYKAQSPDEAALVQAAADVGFIFCGRDKNILKLQTPADEEPVEYELLEVLEFTSSRKRMSVIVRKLDDANQSIFLLMKGADNIIFERLKPGQDELTKTTGEHLDGFASEGLRTLTLAYKGIDEADYLKWSKDYHEASLALDDREERLEEVASRIERDVMLLGATAIEDKLQDGVPEAIADLRRTGIKIWVATGDKLETAIAIGMSSNLLSHDMNLIVVRGGRYGEPHSAYDQMRKAMVEFFPRGEELANALEEQPPGLERTISGNIKRPDPGNRRLSQFSGAESAPEDLVGQNNGARGGGYGLVIEGTALTYALTEPWSKEMLLELATRCQAVICCRTSPLQKALIVKLVREGLGAMTLAIGDGANDVSMIQAADVGVGVAGEEGLQAVNSSDYAIGQFRFLVRLLLVHGHWSYARNANMIVNFFYKEMIGIAILFFFQFYCAFSTTTIYEYTYLLFWNIFWTLLPVLAIGIFDRSVNDQILMALPELYHYGRRGAYFGLWRFSWYMIDGVYQGAIIYFLLIYTYATTTARPDGYSLDQYVSSTTMVITAVFAANLYNGLNTHAWNWWVFGAVIIGPILILAYTAVYSSIRAGWIWTFVYGNNTYLWPSAYFWLGGMLTLALALLPRFIVRYWKEYYYPTDIDILKYYAKNKPQGWDFSKDPALLARRTMTERPRLSQQDGRPSFAMQRVGTFSHTQGDTLDRTYSRGFQFDQDDEVQRVAVVGPLRRYTSSMNDEAKQNRPRSGSVRRMAHALNVFPALRERSDTLRRTVLRPRSRSQLPRDGERPVSGDSAASSPHRPSSAGGLLSAAANSNPSSPRQA